MKDSVLRLIKEGKSHRQINRLTGAPLATISKWRNEGGSRVLCIGDLHEPCAREEYIDFCKDIQKKYRTNKTVFLGDVFDHSVISFHDRHPNAPGAKREHELMLERIKVWHKAFPNSTVCWGNHDERPNRLAKSVNIPAEIYLKSYNDIWKTKTWTWVQEYILDGVKYFHGDGYSGIYPYANASKNEAMSVVLGHCHSVAGIHWHVNSQQRWFGMSVGSGIDDKTYAFEYGIRCPRKSVISCGVVIDGHPYLELMPLEKYK